MRGGCSGCVTKVMVWDLENPICVTKVVVCAGGLGSPALCAGRKIWKNQAFGLLLEGFE